MRPSRTIISVVAAIAMGAAIAGPVAGAAPTYSGVLTCSRASDGQVEELNSLEGATRQDIIAWRKFWTSSGYCANGSFDTSALTKD